MSLDHGSNEAINSLTGGNTLLDHVPIDWKDRLVYRAGLDYALNDNFNLQLGYSYGRSPVPTSLTTPLNGSIFEHTLTAGFRTVHGSWQLGMAYQYNLPNAEGIGPSGYLSQEYSHSRIKVSAHLLSLSASYKF